MALNQEQFDTLISKLESYAQEQPYNYKLRVGLLAVVGYAYIFMTLAILLIIFLGFVGLIFYTRTLNAMFIKLGVLVFVPIFVVLRSLWVNFPAPEGLKVNRQDVPKLFKMIDELSNTLKTPKFDYILLTEDFNAAVVQRPRFGLFGWSENYLLLGFPLMQGLSPVQFSAVIAHELGHLSGNHSRFAGWIYRIQKTYYQILEQLQQSGDVVASSILQSFFNWYAPFFTAYSFVLRRMNEYEADECANKLLGSKNIGEALINVDVQIKLLSNSFWPSVYKQNHELIEPPTQIYTKMSSLLLNSGKNDDSLRFLQQCLAEKTDYQDTHPCLLDRLKAIGYIKNDDQELILPKTFPINAAREYLGNSLTKFTEYFEQAWCDKIQTPWRQRYAYAQESLEKLTNLEARAKIQSLDIEETWQLAAWTYEFRSEDEAIPILQEILTNNDNHYSANYLLGRILLQRDDPQGIEYIEKAISRNSSDLIDAFSLIYAFLKKQGNMKAAYSYQDRIDNHYELIWLAKKERSYVDSNDEFQSHNLSAEVVDYLCKQLAKHSNLKTAYLAQKVVRYFSDEPFYVLGVIHKWSMIELEGNNQKFINEIVNSLEGFPGYIYIILLNNDNKSLQKKLRQVADSNIYKKQ